MYEIIEERTKQTKTFIEDNTIKHFITTGRYNYHSFGILEKVSQYPNTNYLVQNKYMNTYSLNEQDLKVSLGDNNHSFFPEKIEFRKPINSLSFANCDNKNEYWFTLALPYINTLRAFWKYIKPGTYHCYNVLHGTTIIVEHNIKGYTRWKLLIKDTSSFKELFKDRKLYLSLLYDKSLMKFDAENFTFTNKQNENIFTIKPPFIQTKEKNIYDGIDFEVDEDKHRIHLKKRIDDFLYNYLLNQLENKGYVIIDPTISLTEEIPITGDTRVEYNHITTNYGASTELKHFASYTGGQVRDYIASMFRFITYATYPTLVSANFNIHATHYDATSGLDVRLQACKALKDWKEGDKDGTTAGTGESSYQYYDNPNRWQRDIDSNYYFQNDSDFSTSIKGDLYIYSPSGTSGNISTTFTMDVKNVFSSGIFSFGLFHTGSGVQTQEKFTFISSENADISHHPYLEVTYSGDYTEYVGSSRSKTVSYYVGDLTPEITSVTDSTSFYESASISVTIKNEQYSPKSYDVKLYKSINCSSWTLDDTITLLTAAYTNFEQTIVFSVATTSAPFSHTFYGTGYFKAVISGQITSSVSNNTINTIGEVIGQSKGRQYLNKTDDFDIYARVQNFDSLYGLGLKVTFSAWSTTWYYTSSSSWKMGSALNTTSWITLVMSSLDSDSMAYIKYIITDGNPTTNSGDVTYNLIWNITGGSGTPTSTTKIYASIGNYFDPDVSIGSLGEVNGEFDVPVYLEQKQISPQTNIVTLYWSVDNSTWNLFSAQSVLTSDYTDEKVATKTFSFNSSSVVSNFFYGNLYFKAKEVLISAEGTTTCILNNIGNIIKKDTSDVLYISSTASFYSYVQIQSIYDYNSSHNAFQVNANGSLFAVYDTKNNSANFSFCRGTACSTTGGGTWYGLSSFLSLQDNDWIRCQVTAFSSIGTKSVTTTWRIKDSDYL